MNEQDIHNLLVAGLPISIKNAGVFTPLTVKQVFVMGETNYNNHLSVLLYDRNTLNEASKDEEFHKLDDFTKLLLILLQNPELYELFFQGLNLFFNDEPILHEDGFIYFGNKNKKIDDNNFWYIQDIIKLANFAKVEKEEKPNFANERARKMWEKIQKNKKKKPQPKSDMDLHSLYSSISCRFQDYSKVLDFTIYQIYDAYQRLANIDNVQYTYHGVYSGTVDSKSLKPSELNWAKIIQDNK